MSKNSGFVGCIDRNAVYRESHDLDKDGVCIFCDDTPQRAAAKERERSLEADRRAAMVRGDRAWLQRERRLEDQLEDLADRAADLASEATE